MAIKKGEIKTSNGDVLYPKTSWDNIENATEIIDVSDGITQAVKDKVTANPSCFLRLDDCVYTPYYYDTETSLPYMYVCNDVDETHIFGLEIDWDDLSFNTSYDRHYLLYEDAFGRYVEVNSYIGNINSSDRTKLDDNDINYIIFNEPSLNKSIILKYSGEKTSGIMPRLTRIRYYSGEGYVLQVYMQCWGVIGVSVGDYTITKPDVLVNGDILVPMYGPKFLYDCRLHDSFWCMGKRYYCEMSIHPITFNGQTYPKIDTSKQISDNGYIMDSPPSSSYNSVDNPNYFNKLFDGSTDTIVYSTSGDKYIKIRIIPIASKQTNYSPSASNDSFPDYPYGDFIASCYYGSGVSKIQYATYNKHSALPTGWWSITEGVPFGDNAHMVWKITDNSNYTRTVMDFWFIGDGNSSSDLRPTALYWLKNRVSDIDIEQSYFSKSCDETLVNKVTWKTRGETTAEINPNGNATFTELQYPSGAYLTSPGAGDFTLFNGRDYLNFDSWNGSAYIYSGDGDSIYIGRPSIPVSGVYTNEINGILLPDNREGEYLATTSDIPDANDSIVALVGNAITNLNGRVFQNYTAVDSTISGYTVKIIKKNGNKCSEADASDYLKYMTARTYVPTYNYDFPRQVLFIFADASIWKAQYDSSNGLVLYKVNQILTNLTNGGLSNSVLLNNGTTSVTNANEVALGVANLSNPGQLFSIGNGTPNKTMTIHSDTEDTETFDTVYVSHGDTVTFDFKFTSGSKVNFRLEQNSSNYFGYYRVNSNGTLGDNYSGVSIAPTTDGYYRVSINTSQIKKKIGNPTSFNRITTWGNFSDANGIIRINVAHKSNVFEVYDDGYVKVNGSEVLTFDSDLIANKITRGTISTSVLPNVFDMYTYNGPGVNGLVPVTGTKGWESITSGVSLKTKNACKNYYDSSITTDQTDSPTTSGFIMNVFSMLAPNAFSEINDSWQYRVQKLLDNQGFEFIRNLHSENSSSQIQVSPWMRTVVDSSSGYKSRGSYLVVPRNSITLIMDTSGASSANNCMLCVDANGTRAQMSGSNIPTFRLGLLFVPRTGKPWVIYLVAGSTIISSSFDKKAIENIVEDTSTNPSQTNIYIGYNSSSGSMAYVTYSL